MRAFDIPVAELRPLSGVVLGVRSLKGGGVALRMSVNFMSSGRGL